MFSRKVSSSKLVQSNLAYAGWSSYLKKLFMPFLLSPCFYSLILLYATVLFTLFTFMVLLEPHAPLNSSLSFLEAYYDSRTLHYLLSLGATISFGFYSLKDILWHSCKISYGMRSMWLNYRVPCAYMDLWNSNHYYKLPRN